MTIEQFNEKYENINLRYDITANSLNYPHKMILKK